MNAQAQVRIEPVDWTERNQRWLMARIDQLRHRLERLHAGGAMIAEPAQTPDGDFEPALLHCANVFALSDFERDVLLLCAGVSLDVGLARVVADMTGNVDGAPTFALAMSAFDAPHWDAMSPQAPLRYWRLITHEAKSLSRGPLRIDERVLHYLTGVAAIDERLEAMVTIVPSPPPSSPSQTPDWVAQVVASAGNGDDCIHLTQPGGSVSLAQLIPLLAAVGRPALWVRNLPEDPEALNHALRLLDREAGLMSALVVMDLRDDDGRGTAALTRMRSHLRGAFILLGGDAARLATTDLRVCRVALPAWTADLQRALLSDRAQLYGAAGGTDLREAIAASCEQFVQSDPGVLDQVARTIATAGHDPATIAQASWQALRKASRGSLDALAMRIESDTTLDNLVLPNAQRSLLRAIIRQLQHRRRVHREWGFAGCTNRGLGIAALFTGESGTGKTMAAEAIANAAGLDLYRIDLASTVSKYIGETEKNLKKIFDGAEGSGAVLLFDEADALFGKRSEVKDSHDRYANIETAYLLQRIETYRGLAILTTNMKGALDRAFLRRIRFVVQFPFPDEAARRALWLRQFPPQAPLADDIGWDALARMQLTGGHIRSVALNAAFMAAHEDRAIAHAHLIAAAQAELAKLERGLRTQGAKP